MATSKTTQLTDFTWTSRRYAQRLDERRTAPQECAAADGIRERRVRSMRLSSGAAVLRRPAQHLLYADETNGYRFWCGSRALLLPEHFQNLPLQQQPMEMWSTRDLIE
jgi:hypothetical protein